MESTDQPTIVIEGGPEDAEPVDLSGTTSLGREPTNDDVVDYPGASREHAQIVEAEDGFRLRDLNSTNGTFVNDRRVRDREHLLKDGDRIRLGASEVTLVFRHPVTVEPEAEPEAEMPAPSRPAPVQPTVEQPPVEEAAPEEAIEAAAPLEPPKAGVAGLIQRLGLEARLRLRRAPKAPEEAGPLSPMEEAAPQVALSPRARVSRAYRDLRGDIALRRRRRTIAMSLEGSVARVVVVEGTEVVAWGAADPREGDPFEDEPAADQLAEVQPEAASVEEPIPEEVGDHTNEEQPSVEELPQEENSPILEEAGEQTSEEQPSADEVPHEEHSPSPEDAQHHIPRTIGALLRELRAKRARLVTDLPLYIPLVRHLRLPQLKRRFLVSVVMSEVTGAIPFAQEEVDIKWQIIKSDTGSSAMAIAVQKGVVDAHVQRMKEAGKGPSSTYSQAAALGLAAGVPDAMIVHLAENRESVVLVRGGVPQAVLQVAGTEGGDTSLDKAEAMARAVEQMEGYDQTLGASAGDERLPLVLTGEVPGDGRLEEDLRQMLDREVLPLSPPLDWPEGFPVAEYATGVGLALLDRGRRRWWRRASDHSVPALSLLSERHLPAPLPVRAIAVFAALAAFALAAFILTPTVEAKRTDADANLLKQEAVDDSAREHRLNVMRARKLQQDSTDVRHLTLEMKTKFNGLRAEIEELGEWFEKIETITIKTRPSNVIVSNLAPKADKFTLTGRAQTFEDTVQYASNIRNHGTRFFYEVGAASSTDDGEVSPEAQAIPAKSLAAAMLIGLTTADSPGAEEGSMLVAWSPSTSTDATLQRLFRSTSLDGPFSLLATFADNTTDSYTDTGLSDATAYFYVIEARAGLFIEVSVQQVGSAGAPLVLGSATSLGDLGLLAGLGAPTQPVRPSGDAVGGTGLDFVIRAVAQAPPVLESEEGSEEGSAE